MARAIHVCPRYAPAHGGVESFFRRLSEHLASRGDDVEVWTTDAATVRAFTAAGDARLPAGLDRLNGVPVRRFPVRYVPLQKYTRTAAHLLPFGEQWKCNTLRWTPWVPSLSQAARRHDRPVDVVHAGPLPYSSLLHAAAVLADRTGAKLIISPFTHVPPPGDTGRRMAQAYLSALNLRLLARATVVCAQTRLERDLLAAAGVAADRLAITGVGVDPADVSGGDRQRARAAWRIGGDVVVVGHLANKSRDKGTFDLLDAAERLWDAGQQFVLVLAGPAMAGYDGRLARSQHRQHVVDLGELSDADRRDFFASIDVFALPSYVESFGISALEAASCGVPVIGYAHGGPREIFQDGVTALLPAVGDVSALTAAIGELTGSADRRTRLRDAALAIVDAHQWPGALGRAGEIYRKLTG
ncbi:MAG TPA: glycosyltransferase family 4 protein [Vicinamibacterales bacterium]|nr:glycosyltransferase family 4 protein [Vicinamibacterales bacterium]